MIRVGACISVGLALTLLGCSSNSGGCADDPSAAADYSCAAGISYDDHFYAMWNDSLPAEKGAPLGEAFYPPCNDQGCGAEEDDPGVPTKVWRLRGADPAEVVVGRAPGVTGLVVFGKGDADPRDYFRFTDAKTWVRRSR